MNKSTPLTQIPNMNFASQAQQQQPTQIPTTDKVDDDMTIQDALEALTQDTSNEPSVAHELPVYNPSVVELPSPPQMQVSSENIKEKILSELIIFDNDFKTALIAAGLFIVLHSLPIEKYIYKYISLDKIPYSNLVIKAISMFLLVLVVTKLTK